MSSEVIRTVAEATPPVGIGGALLYGITLSDWALALTITVLVVQLVTGVLRLRREWRERNERSPGKEV